MNNKNWKALFFLSIIVPMGLLTTFKFSGIIQETQVTETINARLVTWNMIRPSIEKGSIAFIQDIFDPIKSQYRSEEISANVTIHTANYRENSQVPPYYGTDNLELRIGSFASMVKGHIVWVRINILSIDDNAYFNIIDSPYWAKNLIVNDIKDFGEADHAFVDARPIGNPKNCELGCLSDWVFYDENTESHQIMMNVEIFYFNLTIHKKLVMPINIEISLSPSEGRDFDTAIELDDGLYVPTPLHLRAYPDFYKVCLASGQMLNITLVPKPNGEDVFGRFDLFLYDQNRVCLDQSVSSLGGVEAVQSGASPYSGVWFVKIVWEVGIATYSLEVEIT
jgi:hypothetical protein